MYAGFDIHPRTIETKLALEEPIKTPAINIRKLGYKQSIFGINTKAIN